MKLSYRDQLERLIRKALKQRDLAQANYYIQRQGCAACASWEVFQGSWAYDQWLARGLDKQPFVS